MNANAKLQAWFSSLSDANRLLIIRFIGKASRSVSEIVGGLGLSQPLVSHHLRVLREQQILMTKREGPFIYYELNDPRLLDALGLFAEIAGQSNCDNRAEDRMFCCPHWFKKVFK